MELALSSKKGPRIYAWFYSGRKYSPRVDTDVSIKRCLYTGQIHVIYLALLGLFILVLLIVYGGGQSRGQTPTAFAPNTSLNSSPLPVSLVRRAWLQVTAGPAAMRLAHVDLFAVENEVYHVASKGR